MPYPNKQANDARQMVKPAFISVATYSAMKGISPAQGRREVVAGKVPYVRSGDRILIPADEPERQAAAARAEFELRQAECARKAEPR